MPDGLRAALAIETAVRLEPVPSHEAHGTFSSSVEKSGSYPRPPQVRQVIEWVSVREQLPETGGHLTLVPYGSMATGTSIVGVGSAMVDVVVSWSSGKAAA